MRLIHVETHELREFNNPPNKFAILSHRWIDDQEVRLQDWEAYIAKQEPTSSEIQRKLGFIKIQNTCRQAKSRGLEWLWADTACIDKTNHLEVGKSINLMFSWYQSASICFVYLHDTSTGNPWFERTGDPLVVRQTPGWFTRGWTLQELLAPSKILFFDQHWNYLGDRTELSRVIHKVTNIPLDVLCGKDILSYSYGDRLSWAKDRQTKEPEDRVYSLLGLLGVTLPAVGYGIGLRSALWQLESAIDRQRIDGNLSLPDDELFSRFITEVESSPTENAAIDLPTVAQAAFNSQQRQYEPVCLKDTRVDVLQEIRNWAQSDDTRRVFWLNGRPGTGKSTIARTIAREYYEKDSLGASFFFTRGGGDLARAEKFFPTVAMQLTTQIPSLLKYISASLSKHPEIAKLSLNDQWNHLIVKPLTNLKYNPHQTQLLIVIDALDECDGDNDVRTILRLLSDCQNITTAQLRVFITSRPETPIRLGFDKMPSILHHGLTLDNISRNVVDRDIFTFFNNQFSEMTKEYENISSHWPGIERINTLVEKSEGLFIYAATICRFIRNHDHFSPEDLLRIFIPDDSAERPPKRRRKRATPKTLPFSELDKTYTHILEYSLKRIEDPSDREEVAIEVREIISTIAILFQPQSLATLSCILDIDQNAIQLRLKHLRSLLRVPDDNNAPVQTLHTSFRDFLFNNERCTSRYFLSKEPEDHTRLSELCLDILSAHLQEDICNVQRYGVAVSDIEKSRVQQAIPPKVEYACTYWIQHTLNSAIKLNNDCQLYQFLKSHILHWFEALSWIGRLSEGICALSALELEISEKTSPRLFELVHDAKRFILFSRLAIEQAPLQVYASALIFAPQMSILRQNFENRIPQWMKRGPQTDEIWNTVLQTLEGHEDRVTAVVFSPDGSTVASGSWDNTIKLWDARSGQEQMTFKGHENWVTAVVFSPDGSTVASGSSDNTIKLWDARSGQEQMTFKGHESWVTAVVFSPDGSTVASGSWDNTIKLWDARSGQERMTFKGHENSVTAVVFSPDGSTVASGSLDKTIKLWDARSGQEQMTFKGHESWVTAVVFSPDGSTVASGSWDNTIKLWDARSGQEQMTFKGHENWVTAVVFSPDGLTVASGSSDNTIKLWDVRSGQEQMTFKGHEDPVGTVIFSPDGLTVASGSWDKTIKLWDARSGQEQMTFKGHENSVSTVVFSPDGSTVASGSWDKTIKLWDARSGQEQMTFKGHENSVSTVVFSPDGSTVASGSSDNTIKLWDARSGQEQMTFKGHENWVSTVVFSPDGLTVASGSWDNTIKLWDARSGQERMTFEGHKDKITAVAFSLDGLTVASGSWNNTIKLWNARSGQERAAIQIDSKVSKLWFSTNGSQLYTDHDGLDVSSATSLLCRRAALSTPSSLLSPHPLRLFVRDQWIIYGLERLLWLPPEYRPRVLAVHQDILVLGHLSGRISFLEFDLRLCSTTMLPTTF